MGSIDVNGRPGASRRHLLLRWGAVLLLAAAGVAGAFSVTAAGGQTMNVLTYSLDQVAVGALAPSASTMLSVEGRRFPAVATSLASIGQQTPPRNVSIPLTSVLGTHQITLQPVTTVTVDPDLFSVTFVGASATAGGVLANASTQVLVRIDWQSTTDEKPTIVVSARSATKTTLGQILGPAAGSSVATELSVNRSPRPWASLPSTSRTSATSTSPTGTTSPLRRRRSSAPCTPWRAWGGSCPRSRRSTTLLAAWLNLASGATGTDPSGFITDDFARVMADAEAVRLDPQSTADRLFAAQSAVDTAVRNLSRR